MKWLLDPLSAVSPKASAASWTDIISHLWEGISLFRALLEFSSHTVIYHACYPQTTFLQTLLLLSHSNSLSLLSLIGKLGVFMISLRASLVLLGKGSNE